MPYGLGKLIRVRGYECGYEELAEVIGEETHPSGERVLVLRLLIEEDTRFD